MTPPDPVDLVSQLKLIIATMPPPSGATEDVRSYDLVWAIHLAGDAHQPLHAVSRFTHEIPKGDAIGNAESVVPATGETLPRHAYWDRAFGGYSTHYGAVADADSKDGLASVAVDRSVAQVLDPDAWIQESADLAKRDAYALPVGPGKDAAMLTRDYETAARNTARTRAALDAAWLASAPLSTRKKRAIGAASPSRLGEERVVRRMAENFEFHRLRASTRTRFEAAVRLAATPEGLPETKG
jgi:hypothetical protein